MRAMAMRMAMRMALLAAAVTALGALAAPAPAHAEPPAWLEPFYFRAGVARVAPLEDSREMELADVDGAASLALENGPIAGSGATISSATIPAVIVGYRLPWLGRRLSLETIVGLPFTVTFQATGTLATDSLAPTALGLPTGVGPLGPELGEAKAVPIVVTAVYSLPIGRVRPYAGAGPAIMFAQGAKVTNPILTEVAQPDFSIAPSPGLVLQAGAEARLWKQVYARVDVKYIAGMLARASVKHAQVRTPALPLFESVEVGTAKMSMWVNPLIVHAGVGVDF